MKKKKLVIFMLVFIMVLSLALTALVGCNKDDPSQGDDEPPTGYKKMSTTLSSALSTVLENSAKDDRVNALKASAQLTVGVKYGDSTHELVIKFGADVNLKASDNKGTAFGLSIVDKTAGNKNILNVYYIEEVSTNPEDKLGKGDVYLDLGDGVNAQKLRINGLSLKTVLKDQIPNFDVTDENASDIKDDVVWGVQDALDGVLGMILGMGDRFQSNDNNTILFRLSLDKLFEKAGDLLDGLSIIDEFTEEWGLTLKSTDIKTLLPSISIDVLFNLNGASANMFEEATFTGMDAKLSVGSKDMRIKRTDGTDFVRINLDKKSEVSLGLDFAFGAKVPSNYMPYPLDNSNNYGNYKAMNAINFTAEGELELKKPLSLTVTIGEEMEIGIPAGTYSIKIAADIDPRALIGMQFNANGTNAILDLVGNIVNNAVDYLGIEIVDKANPTDESKQLKIAIKPQAAGLPLSVSVEKATLLGEDIGGLLSVLDGLDIGAALDMIKGFLPADTPTPTPGSGDASGEVSGNVSGDASGNQTASGEDDAWKAVVGDIVKNLTIIVNGGSADITMNNQSVATNGENSEGTKIPDTTLDITASANSNGLKITADIKNIVTDRLGWTAEKATNIHAVIEANANGITITANATNLNIGDINLPIDLVLKLTKFTLGNCPTVE